MTAKKTISSFLTRPSLAELARRRPLAARRLHEPGSPPTYFRPPRHRCPHPLLTWLDAPIHRLPAGRHLHARHRKAGGKTTCRRRSPKPWPPPRFQSRRSAWSFRTPVRRHPGWQFNAGQAMNPASTMKLVTTLPRLSCSGRHTRGKTTAWSSGTPDNGVLAGDRMLRGGADPRLTFEQVLAVVAASARARWRAPDRRRPGAGPQPDRRCRNRQPFRRQAAAALHNVGPDALPAPSRPCGSASFPKPTSRPCWRWRSRNQPISTSSI